MDKRAIQLKQREW